MLNGEVFTLNVPRLNVTSEASSDLPVADGCSSNNNYYTDGIFRGTCCCSCDKDAEIEAF